MRNTLIFSIALLLLMVSFITSYGHESINIFPKYVYNDTSKIVLQYTYKNKYYDTYHLTLSLDSSGIVFENTTVYVPHIEKNKLLTLNITGHIVSYNQSYLIVIYKRYLLDDSPISGVHLVKIYRTYNRSTELDRKEVRENITLQYNQTKREIANKSIYENKTSVDINKTTAPITVKNKTSELIVNISEGEEKDTSWEKNVSEDIGEKENVSLYNQSEDEIILNKKDYVLYIVLGLISGIITGLIVIYILSL